MLIVIDGILYTEYFSWRFLPMLLFNHNINYEKIKWLSSQVTLVIKKKKQKNLPVQEIKRYRFNPWIGKISWKRNGNPFQYSCEKNHGQRGLVGYSLWGCKEFDMTKRTQHTCTPWQFFKSKLNNWNKLK